MPDDKQKLDVIIKETARISSDLGIEPFELTKAQFLKFNTTAITQRTIESLGGFRSIVTDHFGGDHNKSLSIIHGARQKRTYINRLERNLGQRDYFFDTVYKGVIKELLEFKFPSPISVKKPKISKELRHNNVLISDTHFGLNIDQDELGSVNKYNWTIAARRMALLADQVASFKIERRKETPTLTISLGGDLAQGLIHLSDAGTDLITHQIIGTVHILKQFIDYQRQFYKHINVQCTTDNHLRMIHKGSGRATSQKYDSFATLIHCTLAQGFKHCKDVKFFIPKTPYTIFKIFGNSFYLTHGDTLIDIGYPGKRINVDNITNAINRLNSTLKDKEQYKAIMVGHVHTPVFMTLDNGTELVVNGTGSGLDTYAQSIGISHSNPAQIMFESTEKFPVGDQRKVQLKPADNDSAYESIIKPYNYELLV